MVIVARADLVGCLIARLRSFTELTALVGTSPPRISAERQDAWQLPTKAVLLRQAGGPADDDYALGRERTRLDVTCYGSTGREASNVAAMVHAIFVPRQGERVAAFTLASCRVDDIVPEAGPASLTEPTTGWPFVFRPYVVRWWSLT